MDLRQSSWWCLGFSALLAGLLLLSTNAIATAGTVSFELPQNIDQSSALDDAGEAAVKPTDVESDRERRLKKRLLTVALAGAAVLMLLVVAHGYLRLELTTRGFYSGRLQIALGIASLGVVAAAYFLWRWLVAN